MFDLSFKSRSDRDDSPTNCGLRLSEIENHILFCVFFWLIILKLAVTDWQVDQLVYRFLPALCVLCKHRLKWRAPFVRLLSP